MAYSHYQVIMYKAINKCQDPHLYTVKTSWSACKHFHTHQRSFGKQQSVNHASGPDQPVNQSKINQGTG